MHDRARQNNGKGAVSAAAEASELAISPNGNAIDRQRGGVRRLTLSDPARLDYISQGLTDITGYTREDLREQFDDEYARIVHPDDRPAFLAFDAEMRRGETTQSLEYRIVRKDGEVVRVLDIMNSHLLPDGTMTGYSLVAIVGEEEDAGAGEPAGEAPPEGAQGEHAAEDDIPYGLVVYSHELDKITSINKRFWELLGSTDENDSLHRLIRANPVSIIPAVDQARFRKAALNAKRSDEPVTFETHLWHTGGYLVEVAGWLTYAPEGDTYRLALVDVTRERNRERQGRRELRIKNFETIYDTLFLFDVQQQTALCYKYDGEAPFDTTGTIRIMLSDAIEHIIANICAEASREAMRKFLAPLTHNGAAPSSSQAAVDARANHMDDVHEHARHHSRLEFTATCCNKPDDCEAVLIDAEADAYFFGCRHFTMGGDGVGSHHTSDALELSVAEHYVLPSPESGLFAFSAEHGRAQVLFANERGCKFLDGGEAPDGMLPVDVLLARTPITHEQLVELLSPAGKGMLVLKDERRGGSGLTWRCVLKRDARSSHRAVIFAFEVPTWAAKEEREAGNEGTHPGIVVKTFGYFDVFVNGQAVVFSSAKAKELLALLVDRRGGFVSANDAISYLWENEAATPTVLARQRKVAMRMKNTLDEYGIGHIVNVSNGQRSLNVDAVKCDLYDYLAGVPDVKFPGTYLQNYSWGEITLGELLTTMPFHA